MTVKDLKKHLEACDDEDLVVMSKDAEGNSYSPLAGIGEQMYVAESTWNGVVYEKELTPEMQEQGFSEEDIRKEGEDGAVKCVTLWPTN